MVTAFLLVVSALVALAMVARHLRRLGQRRLGQRFLGRHFVVVDAERPFFMGSVVTRTCAALQMEPWLDLRRWKICPSGH